MKNKIITIVLTAILLASAGCSSMRSSTQTPNASAPNNSSAPPSQAAAAPSTPQNPAGASSTESVKSIYTDLSGKGCGPERRTSEVSSERTCAGIEGYKLLIHNDDERDSITIITPDGRQHPLNFWETISKGAFDYVGQKAEWRVANKNGKDLPIALIVRVEVQSNGSNKGGSYLAVSKISERGICVTDRIDPVANANEKAREAADSSANKPCLADTGK
jgi:hypothetical protein